MESSDKDYSCTRCNTRLNYPAGTKPARADDCPSCKTDLHSCIQCEHYDPAAYNQCRESQAERVVDKERANFCDYFTLARGRDSSGNQQEQDARKKLDDLFK